MISNNIFALLITFIIAVAWLRLVDFFASKKWITSKTSRKIIHIGTGPIFILCWLLFPNNTTSRYYAACVPIIITIQFLLVGSGIIRDEAAVEAMSRSGDRREILYGPLYYGIIFVVITITYWRTSPIGITALLLMCGGDGFAELIGTRFGVWKIPWNRKKSVIGSISFILAGYLLTISILAIFIKADLITLPTLFIIFPLLVISVICSFVESLDIDNYDNLTVTLTAMIGGYLLY